ncbi:MAG: hypothetical protein J5649_06270 [Lachnospiraceae bacterium]|nr:hypothetical protein [Lachnospiraceae bacterium]
MSLFKRNSKIDETERRRLWDGLAEFLRLNFRPDSPNSVGAAPVSADACKVGSLEAQESAIRKAAAAMLGNRAEEAQAYLANSAMPANQPGFPVASSTAMMMANAVPAGGAGDAGRWDMDEAEAAEEIVEAEAAETVAEATEAAADVEIESPAGMPELDALDFPADEEEELPESLTAGSMTAVEDAKQSFPVSAETLEYREKRPLFGSRRKTARKSDACFDAASVTGAGMMNDAVIPAMKEAAGKPVAKKRSLGDVVKQVGETWQQSLLRMIDERGFTDTEVYKRAGLDRKLFSKIRCNEAYQPKKPTAVALALALQLSLDEMKDMLARAGYAFSPSSRFDLIVEYFIENEVYDVDTINIALYEYGQQLLGA